MTNPDGTVEAQLREEVAWLRGLVRELTLELARGHEPPAQRPVEEQGPRRPSLVRRDPAGAPPIDQGDAAAAPRRAARTGR